MAYQQALTDGANVIDCSVQITKDGLPICLPSADLSISTTVTQTNFSSLLTTIKEVQSASGIFTFNLTLSDIRTLTRKYQLSIIILSQVQLYKAILK